MVVRAEAAGMRRWGLPATGGRGHVVLNAVVFQCAWLACVLGGTSVALPVTALTLGLHLWLSGQRRVELRIMTAAVVIGLLCDSILINTGVLQVPGRLPPLWLLCLWPLFATTLGLALRWFLERPLASAAGGLLFAPMSYFGGSRLAGIGLLQPEWLALLYIGLAWALVFPLLARLHRRWSTCHA